MPQCPYCQKSISIGTTSCPYCRLEITEIQPSPGDDLEQRVKLLLSRQRKIEAVKLYMDETGSGLADSKKAVEQWQAGSPPAGPDESGGDWQHEVLRLLSEQKKLQAAKLYRQHMGGDLIEAKRAVEALGEQHGLVDRGSGCLGVFVWVAIGILTGLSLIA